MSCKVCYIVPTKSTAHTNWSTKNKSCFLSNGYPDWFIDKQIKIFLNKRYKNTPSINKQERTTGIRRILLYMLYLGETSVQLGKELRHFFPKYLKELGQLTLIHRTHTIGDHFKYKDKQAHLERSNVVYKLKCSCGNSYIGQTQRNLKFRLEEHNPLKSNHQKYRCSKTFILTSGSFRGL